MIMNKLYWRQLNVLYKLLVVNVAVFLTIILIKLITFLLGMPQVIQAVVRFFSLPAAPVKLLIKPWTLFTYMFLHEGFWHIFANMLWLYFLGLIFIQYFSEKQLWRVYLISGLIGGLFFFIAYNIFPVFWGVKNYAYLLGASAAVSGIVIAVAAYRPQETILIFGILPMPMWLLGVLYVLYDVSMLTVDNPGGHLAHLGGALFGLWFGLAYHKGKDITAFMDRLALRKKPRMRVHKNDYRPDDYEWNRSQREIEEELNRILDKISRKGYNSLTKKEREFLKRHSRDYRGFYG